MHSMRVKFHENMIKNQMRQVRQAVISLKNSKTAFLKILNILLKQKFFKISHVALSKSHKDVSHSVGSLGERVHEVLLWESLFAAEFSYI
jgi:hypothetical protein